MQAPILKLTKEVSSLCRRNIGVFAPCWQKASDPIQQLFLDKIREYRSKSSGGKLVQPSPELEQELKNDKQRILNQFGMKAGEDITKFPTFKFDEPVIESPGLTRQEN